MRVSRAWFAASLALLAGLGGACSGDGAPRSAELITAEDIASHIQVLAADSFEGRGTASPAEEKVIQYLTAQFQALGLVPGNGDSWVQQVPLVEITANPQAVLTVVGATGGARFPYGRGFMAWTKRVVPAASVVGSELVFVGYGIVAPEYGWNDYRDLDVRGKTVVILVNDPGYVTRDSTLFEGTTMTYHGRWTYKFEEAARQGAAGALIVHETGPAGYPWEVVQGSWSGPQYDLVRDDNNRSRVAVEGWIPDSTAREIFRLAGQDFDSLKARATRRTFAAVRLGVRASIRLDNTIRRTTSRNLLALLPGTEQRDEFVVYTAHWDHLGRDPSLPGDQIYNGALDNASGTAGLLALARAFAAAEPRPRRSVLFLAVTAEERGLIGSAYYATHPVHPLNRTVGVINLDGLNIWGRTRDLTIIGYGKSELDDYVDAAARAQGRHVRPDPEPEKGFYYRSDHFSFAKQGVPALFPDAGVEDLAHGEQWARQQRDEYTAERYHKPGDQYNPAWDLSGGVEDLRLFLAVGYRLANQTTFPNWRPGTEFRAKRDADMAGR
jgi:Zn-dependent M28 family amino/carboxypeptidase